MAMTDPIADMLTRIRNAQRASHELVNIPSSKLKINVAKVLKSEGYIKNFKKTNIDSRNVIRIFLKYDDTQKPIIHGIKKISTPGRRIYSGYRKMPRIFNGHGILIVSTSTGVITGKKATERKVGGELICSVW